MTPFTNLWSKIFLLNAMCKILYRAANGSGLSPNYRHNTVPSNVPKHKRGILFFSTQYIEKMKLWKVDLQHRLKNIP